MTRSNPRAVAGMTLVELLVVVAIIGLLAVTVLPNLAGADGQREVRLAAATVSSQLARGPALAIEQRRSAGIWLEPLASNPWACIDLYSAVVPPPYRGDSFNAAFEVEPQDTPNPAFKRQARNWAVLSPVGDLQSMATLADLSQPGNLIQFNDGGLLCEIRAGGSAGAFVALLRNLSGQSASNTVWPAPPPAAHPFEIHRLPTRLGQPLVLGGGAAIDLHWSGMGNFLFATDQLYKDAGGQSTTPPRITLLCDAAGGFSELCLVASSPSFQTARIPVTAPVYLLVGRLDRCGPPSAGAISNWQSPDSFWIGIDPQSGIVKVTEVKPNAASPLDSQEYIRAGLTAVRL